MTLSTRFLLPALLITGTAIAQQYAISQSSTISTFSFGANCFGQTFTPSVGITPNPGAVTSLPLTQITFYRGNLGANAPSVTTYLNIYDGDPNGAGVFIGSSTNAVDTTVATYLTPYVWSFNQLPLNYTTTYWAIMSSTNVAGNLDGRVSLKNDGNVNAYPGGAGINANLILHATGVDCVFEIRFHAGVMGSFTVSGSNCPSSVGVAGISSSTLPAIAQTLQIDLSNTSPVGIPLMIVGLNALPSPIPVQAFLPAAPSCELQITPDLIATLGFGTSTNYQLPIPNDTNLLSISLFFQAAQLEAGGTSVTQFAAAVIGN